MSGISFGNMSLNSQPRRPKVDRFVPTREEVLDSVWKQKLFKTPEPSGAISRKYANYLNEEFGLEPLKIEHPVDQNYLQHWPCVQRKKKYMCARDKALYAPSFNLDVFSEVLDWSNDNLLVALDRMYYKWSFRSQSLVSESTCQYRIQCCKFDPSGDIIILGTDTRVVEIYNNADGKLLNSAACFCAPEYGCSITTMDWSPTGNSFITGCTLGYLVTFDRRGLRLNWRCPRQDFVRTVRVSPDARYVAVVGYVHSDVMLLLWPSLETYSKHFAGYIVNALAWHPWRSALLGVGANTINQRTRLTLWDAPSSKVRETTFNYERGLLETMLFSRCTGELVASLRSPERYQDKNTQLLVMSDPWTVVDHNQEGRPNLDRICTMVFSPDGTKLATATIDEELILWDFLPEGKDKNKKKTSKRFSALPVYLDESSMGFTFR